MASIPLTGVKRSREESCLYERAVILRVSAGSARHKLSISTERQNVEKEKTSLTATTNTTTNTAAAGCSLSCRTEEGRIPYVNTMIWSGCWKDAAAYELSDVCLDTQKETNPQRLEVTHMYFSDENKRTPLQRRVEVSVSRGDTGKHHRFFFLVSPPSLSLVTAHTNGEMNKVNTTEYCNTVVRELLRQVSVEAALPVGDAWSIVYHGKSVQSQAGVEMLLSALFSESCQRIPLAVFPVLKGR
ncbi:uncharacterized protein TM35_000044910 [Trypanosoma theileri]|uniref:Uncharacterized protein n=1 Tax=Trypanosoma theileri TaxID=67003 RepID=A0A1X0P5R8_9TRYP|nr:uncharacterized protein TM35_000044910 [Trypanosoma theileri]ORC92277.1 hypothetical protein TM35_000044910 [Trypanosoma theileri]